MSFFRAAAPLLARPAAHEADRSNGPGQILVTLFEQPPYTLWNVRDLARHVGLRPITSSQFQFDAYPGYKHARTLGNIHVKGVPVNGEESLPEVVGETDESERKRAGKWRGEERKARLYVFEYPSEDVDSIDKSKRPKRKADDDSSDDD